MILHGDGSTNIFVKDGLLPFSQYEKEQAPNVLHDSSPDPYYLNKNVNGNFDIILTNPPFSVELDNDTKKTLKKSFVFGDKKNSENLFVERWYQLLRENGRLAAVLPDNIFDTTENKYIRLFIYKYFKVKAVVSLPQLTFQPYTSTKTSVLFAQKKTKSELEQWNKVWKDASEKYSSLKKKVENLIAVHDGKKVKNKLRSIRELKNDEERNCIIQLLKDYLLTDDENLSTGELIEKYREELKELCKYDKGTVDAFGHVNTWWVFSEISSSVNNDVFMAEVDNVGYKRTNRGENEMPNELFTLEYAPQKIDLGKVKQDFFDKIELIKKGMEELEAKITNEKDSGKRGRLKKELEILNNDKITAENDSREIESFLSIYYDKNGKLLEQYIERMDEKLISEFKNGRLEKYKSNYVALHQKTSKYVLDYMRKISWD
jgi:type I restriction enzyme M protein